MFVLGRFAAVFALSAVIMACVASAGRSEAAQAFGASALAPSPDVHQFRIGVMDAWSLKDGDVVLPVGGKDTPWKDPAIPALLSAAGQPSHTIALSNQPLLVRDGERLVLIDAGSGRTTATEGRLSASLAAAGFRPDQITDVLISDYFDDHLGGLVTPEGGLVFANATIHIPAADWEAMKPYPGDAVIVAAISAKVHPFAPGAVVTPNITAVPLAGHTESHTGYEVVSGPGRLLYFGDALQSSVLSVANPEWKDASDFDEAASISTRRALLERAATQNLRLYGSHFPFPGVGRVQKVDAGYVWVPEP